MATLLEELDDLKTEQLKALVVEVCVYGQSDLVVATIDRWKADRNALSNERKPGDDDAAVSPYINPYINPSTRSPTPDAASVSKATRKRKRDSDVPIGILPSRFSFSSSDADEADGEETNDTGGTASEDAPDNEFGVDDDRSQDSNEDDSEGIVW